MWSPGLVSPMFCHLVAPLVFPQDPQETGETRDDPQSIKAEGSGAVGWRRSRSLCCMFSTRASLSPPEAGALRVARVAHSARSTCLASAVPLEDRRHVVRVLQKPPPETEGQGAKDGPKEPAEGAAEGAAARAEV